MQDRTGDRAKGLGWKVAGWQSPSAPSVVATGLMRLMLAGHLCRCKGEPKWRKGPSTVARTGQIKSRRAPEWVQGQPGGPGGCTGPGAMARATCSKAHHAKTRCIQGTRESRCTGLAGIGNRWGRQGRQGGGNVHHHGDWLWHYLPQVCLILASHRMPAC